jgi:hypothetical protein
MDSMPVIKVLPYGLVLGLLMLISPADINAQQEDTLKGRNIYNPLRLSVQDTIRKYAPTAQQEQRIRDSIEVRLQFVRDSLFVREQFVRDSIQRRQHIRDSVVFLQGELQGLLEAWCRTVKENIVLRCRKISIIGDSALGDFTCIILPFGVTDPYTPWMNRIGLNGKGVKIAVDEKSRKITSVQAQSMKASFIHDGKASLMIIQEPAVVQKNYNGNFYKTPIDSVFLDRFKRVVQIRKYVQFYSLINNNQKGDFLFLNRTLIKQYEYGIDNEIKQYKETRFCDRWKAYETNKVCSRLTYTFSNQGNTYQLIRRNEPANTYSDGTYTFLFDDNENLAGISFNNVANTENWNRLIELNKDGNVSCYVDKKDNIIRQSLCMIYHDKDPQAKYPVETIATTFEKDGISYYQKNNTTGKIRTRDRMTLEWSPWK